MHLWHLNTTIILDEKWMVKNAAEDIWMRRTNCPSSTIPLSFSPVFSGSYAKVALPRKRAVNACRASTDRLLTTEKQFTWKKQHIFNTEEGLKWVKPLVTCHSLLLLIFFSLASFSYSFLVKTAPAVAFHIIVCRLIAAAAFSAWS